MPLRTIRSWLGLDTPESVAEEPLRETLDALDHLEPARARSLAAFAFLLGRIAHADQHVSREETSSMEALVVEHGRVPREQAMLIVQLAKSSNLLFGGTANFTIAREFNEMASYDEKLALMRCVFAVSAIDENISLAEEGEIHKLARELKVEHRDLVNLRVEHGRFLPGIRKPSSSVD